MEVWRDIPGYEGLYQASTFGRIKSLVRRKERVLKPTVRRDGYASVKICGKKQQRKLVHRLVAETFLANPQNKREVNHLDGNKTNNSISNLEWVSPSENKKHAYKTGLIIQPRGKKSKRWRGFIDIFKPDGTFVVQTGSLREAVEWIRENTEYNKKVSKGNISLIVSGKWATAYGFIFRRTKEKK
jgi:hypothetical protein